MAPRWFRSSTVAARLGDLALRGVLGLYGALAILTVVRAPGPVAIASAGLAAVSTAHPLSGLLILAAVVTLGPALGSLSGSISWSEPLVIAFLAGAAIRGALAGPRRSWTLPPAAVLLALTVAASGVIQLTLRRVLMGAEPFRDEMSQILAGGYFRLAPQLGSLTGAALLLEGVGLFVAVSAIIGSDPNRLVRLVRMMVAGAAGAAALNVSRLVNAAIATATPWSALTRLAGTRRISVLYGDVNAAGSYFAMLLCLAVGVAASARRVARLAWAPAAALIGFALWLTSSRAALLAVLVVGAAWTALTLLAPSGRSTAWRRAALRGAGLIAAAALVVAFLPNRVLGGNASEAASIRRDLAIVSVRLLATAPVFGIGVGQFYERSGDEMRVLPVGRIYVRQNAHNNFLQVLAELGIAGFVCFVLVLWSSLIGVRAGLDRPEAPWAIGAVAAGLAAFLVSALFGHPLLVAECAYAFWLLAGAAASFAPRRTGTSWTASLALAACAALLISVPVRARSVVRAADLEHLGYGLSQWQPADDGERYRIAAGAATVFVPGDAESVRIPLRASRASAAPLSVDVRLRGALVDRVQVNAASWSWYRFSVPSRERARFVPLEFVFSEGQGAALHIGKVSAVARRSK